LKLYFVFLVKTLSLKIKANKDFRLFLKQTNNKEGPFLFVPHSVLLSGSLSWGFFYLRRKVIRYFGYSLISNSFEGEIVSKAAETLGIKTVFGSSRKKQKKSFQEIIEINSKGLTNIIVFDGPKGPPLVPKPGIQKYINSVNHRFQKNQQKNSFSGFLFVCKPKNLFFYQLNSWDRLVIPMPFVKFEIELVKIESPEIKSIEKKAKDFYFQDFFD